MLRICVAWGLGLSVGLGLGCWLLCLLLGLSRLGFSASSVRLVLILGGLGLMLRGC